MSLQCRQISVAAWGFGRVNRMRHLGGIMKVCGYCLLLIAVLFFQAGCTRHETLSKQQATTLFARSAELERQGELLAAYHTYKTVEGLYETNDELRDATWDGAQRLRNVIEYAGTDIKAALERYRAANGRYPESLAQIEHGVPKSTAAILQDFQYVRKSDTEFLLNDDLAGTVSFDLR